MPTPLSGAQVEELRAALASQALHRARWSRRLVAK
jgi:hypothetical protein